MPEKGLTFAVGDIHGRADLLAGLQDSIAAEASSAGAGGHKVVYLGDYIDRGPQSQEVVGMVLDGLPGMERHTLCGNHEAMLAAYLDQPDLQNGMSWFRNGGSATLASYGIPATLADFSAAPGAIASRMLRTMPATHRGLLLEGGLELMHEDDHAIFVHAGLNPSVPLAQQDANDLLWIREPFLRSRRDWGKPVVHGHTPSQWGAVISPNRINVDTGAFATGALTAVVLSTGAPRFLVAADACPWQLAIDPQGTGGPAWLGWVMARAQGAGVRCLGACMPDVQARLAEEACDSRGIEFKRTGLDALAAALCDPDSALVAARRTGSVAFTYSGEAALDLFEDAISAARAGPAAFGAR